MRNWQLVREIGIIRQDDPFGSSGPLNHPMQVIQLPNDRHSILILDRTPTGDYALYLLCDKQLVEIDISDILSDHRTISRIAPLGNGQVAIVEEGVSCEVANISGTRLVGRHVLNTGTCAFVNPFCVAAVGESLLVGDGPGCQGRNYVPAGLVLVDLEGNTEWEWRPGKNVLGHATSVTPIGTMGIAITDSLFHRVLMISWDKKLLWAFGQLGRPGSGTDHLSEPRSTTLSREQTLLVSDSLNNRLIELTLNGKISNVLATSHDRSGANIGPFQYPETALQLEDGNILVADSGNSRVISIDRYLQIHWSSGSRTAPKRLLSYPRSFEPIGCDKWLIADTHNNRCIELTSDNRITWQYGGSLAPKESELYWPRCAKHLRDGTIGISDSRNSRLLCITQNGEMIRDTDTIKFYDGSRVVLEDPHDILPAADGGLFLSDASLNMVIKLDVDGNGVWRLGGPDFDVFNDPHQLTLRPDGSVSVADCNGIITIASNGAIMERIGPIYDVNGQSIEFKCPKGLSFFGSVAAISDPHSDVHEIVFVDDMCHSAWEVSNLVVEHSEGMARSLAQLSGTRYLTWLPNGHLMILDTVGHRLVQAKSI